jgi:hypothetical protein
VIREGNLAAYFGSVTAAKSSGVSGGARAGTVHGRAVGGAAVYSVETTGAYYSSYYSAVQAVRQEQDI